MTDEKVVMLKLYNGDFIIGTANSMNMSDNSVDIALNDPRLFMMVPTALGSVGVALRDICAPFNVPRLKKSCEFRRDQVLFVLDESEIDNEVINGYKSEVTGIKIATTADAASFASSSQPGKEIII